MKDAALIFFMLIGVCISLMSQGTVVEGYVFEDGNRGYLNQVNINIFKGDSEEFVTSIKSNKEGFFAIELPTGKNYRLEASKDIFEKKSLTFNTKSEGKVFLKVPMLREQGYLFEVTLAPKREDEDEVVDAITGALIEVYNNTKKEEVLVIAENPSPDFKVHFKKGNHYTILIRKKNYLVKRMEAYVNVEGCILCFEGVGEVRPGVADNLTEGMTMGTLLANVEMIPIYEGKTIELPNVYYEFGKFELTEQGKETLSNLATILADNPHLNIELGSHTDVRGTGPDNRELSEKRAYAAVEFLTEKMDVNPDRITAKGYGESQIKNHCLPGVTCTEEEHAENRRTEIKILEMDHGSVSTRSLASMKVEEEFLRQVLEGDGIEQVSYQLTNDSSEVVAEDEVENDLEVVQEKQDGIQENLERKDRINKAVDKVKKKEKILSKGDDSMNQIDVSRAKKVNASTPGFTGYRIVVHYSNFPISADHEIYKVLSEIETFTTSQKNILYMVGAFDTKEEAEIHLKEEIAENYSNAYIVRFRNGQKIKIQE